MDAAAVALLAFVTLQRFVEFIWDRRNTRHLRAAGAVEFGGLHYPAIMLVHAGWLAGLWVLGYDSPVIPGYVIDFLVLQVGRYWVLATLGRRWTTRVNRVAWRTAGRKRSVPPAATPELRHRSRRVGAGAVGARSPRLRNGVCRPLRWRRSAARPGREFGFGVRAGGTGRRWGRNHALIGEVQAETRKRPHGAGAFIRFASERRGL